MRAATTRRTAARTSQDKSLVLYRHAQVAARGRQAHCLSLLIIMPQRRRLPTAAPRRVAAQKLRYIIYLSISWNDLNPIIWIFSYYIKK